jgi:hypothetical protein
MRFRNNKNALSDCFDHSIPTLVALLTIIRQDNHIGLSQSMHHVLMAPRDNRERLVCGLIGDFHPVCNDHNILTLHIIPNPE